MDFKGYSEQYIMNTYNRFPIQLESGKGCYLYDDEGNKYLDFGAGIAVNCLGYGDQDFNKALKNQIDQLCHTSNLYYTTPQVEAAKYLVEHSIFSKVFFCNSGAEANEAALKAARKYGKSKNSNKIRIISMEQSFHGRTYGAISLTGQTKYQESFTPILQDIVYVPYNDKDAITQAMDNQICAVILEVIQGEGGIRVADKGYLQYVQSLCEKYDALLIVDEVQTGIGRCGSLFGFEQFGIQPNIVSSAKGLGGGVPIGAMLCDEKADVLEPGDHASTFGGNLLATTAASAVLKRIIEEGLLQQVNESGIYLNQQLQELAQICNKVKEVRGMGLMQGIELTIEQAPVVTKCLEKGLLLVGAGKHVIRFVPPLIISKEEIDLGIKILREALQEVE